jgi:predicted nucleic acid-binding protein
MSSIANFELDDLITSERLQELSQYINVQDGNLAYRAKSGKAELLITKDKAVLSSHYKNAVVVNEYKTTIVGPIHLSPNPSEIQISGYWKFNDEILTCLPSTLYTPIPVLKFREPLFAEEVNGLAKIESALA